MSKKKYYAVKAGRVPGIYGTWDECKKNVDGFSGAIYKSFPTLEEAQLFIGSRPAELEIDNDLMPEASGEQESLADTDDLAGFLEKRRRSEAIAYVDGSYNVSTREYAYGMLLFCNGQIVEAAESFRNPLMASMRNVAGEIEGSKHAMQYCLEHGIKSVDIYYDYAGIEMWALGLWKANKDGTIAYKEYYESVCDRLEVHFYKVKGHSGDMGNERADELAKSALGI